MWTVNIADNGMIVGVSHISDLITHYKRKNSTWSSGTTVKIEESSAIKLIKRFNFVKF